MAFFVYCRRYSHSNPKLFSVSVFDFLPAMFVGSMLVLSTIPIVYCQLETLLSVGFFLFGRIHLFPYFEYFFAYPFDSIELKCVCAPIILAFVLQSICYLSISNKAN